MREGVDFLLPLIPIPEFRGIMNIKTKVKRLATIPARGSTLHAWRITLYRTMGKGKEAKETRLSLVGLFVGSTEPSTDDVIKCLIEDAQAGELSYWDFTQEYQDLPTEEVERAHLACKKLGTRIRRFYGESWRNVCQPEKEKPTVAKPGKRTHHPLSKSA